MTAGDVLRSWRLPDDSVLVEVEQSGAPDYHHLRDGRLVASYARTLASDCELMYVYGYRVEGGRFEHVTHVQSRHRHLIEVGDTVFEGLVELPADSGHSLPTMSAVERLFPGQGGDYQQKDR